MVKAALSAALALVMMLVAGVFPACIPGLCCPSGETEIASAHANMPCCAKKQSMSPREGSTAPRATVSVTVVVKPAVFGIAPPARVETPRLAPPLRYDPSPPLFLRNEQFLI